MPKQKQTPPSFESADALAQLFDDFDFGLETDDFLLYELSRLIEDDRASFEDEEFRRVIDEGIREHIEERLPVRAEMAARLRRVWNKQDESTQRITARTIRALEDIDFPLHNVSLIVRTYTAYCFRRLQETSEHDDTLETEARTLIERWQQGEILREQMTALMKAIGKAAVGPLADFLFDAPEDRMAAETAIDALGGIPCSSSARVLAHAIVEPILEEDLELKAYGYARAMWPLPRHYIIYTLAPHTHEDIPFRWFQLLVECDELASVDMILDEVMVHADDKEYHEDLKALLELLRLSRDPDVEEKIVVLLNSPDTLPDAAQLLEEFIATFRPAAASPDNPWTRATQVGDLHKQYLKAARLHESGKTAEARKALEAILKVDPQYPFATALIRSSQ